MINVPIGIDVNGTRVGEIEGPTVGLLVGFMVGARVSCFRSSTTTSVVLSTLSSQALYMWQNPLAVVYTSALHADPCSRQPSMQSCKLCPPPPSENFGARDVVLSLSHRSCVCSWVKKNVKSLVGDLDGDPVGVIVGATMLSVSKHVFSTNVSVGLICS